jgi:SAM-dependent methyltransferase
MFIDILKSLWRGKSLVRSLMNEALKKYAVYGAVLDVGGGVNPSYYAFLQKKDGTRVQSVDGRNQAIDFEKDRLSAQDDSKDCVLLFNVLEHIYNHNFLAGELFRVVKKEGLVLGFVPFLVNYHPDPHDYFRYTEEALQKIFSAAGFTEVDVKPVGFGPGAVGFNALATLLPRVITAALWPACYLFDSALLKLKPQLRRRYPLGYLFVLRK